jgi:hypothetical protein
MTDYKRRGRPPPSCDPLRSLPLNRASPQLAVSPVVPEGLPPVDGDATLCGLSNGEPEGLVPYDGNSLQRGDISSPNGALAASALDTRAY